eukprot:gene912-967_t
MNLNRVSPPHSPHMAVSPTAHSFSAAEVPSSTYVSPFLNLEHHGNNWISSDPRFFETHFIQLTKRKNKGQAKYRCRMCNHEFTCCGKRRRLQHILGDDLVLGKTKNVINCRCPYLPLKNALIQAYQANGTKRQIISEDFEEREGNNNFTRRVESEEEEGTTLDDFEDLIEHLRTRSSDGHECTSNEEVHESIHTSTSASLSTSPSSDDFQFMPKRMRTDSSLHICSSTDSVYDPSLAVSTDSIMSVTSHDTSNLIVNNVPFSPKAIADYNNRVHLNRAILNFFFIYRIPITAVESQDFREFMDAVQSLQQPPTPTQLNK